MVAIVHIDRARLETIIGSREVAEIAGEGGWNTPEGPRIDEARLSAAIDAANATVEGAVRGRYPQGVTSPELTQAAVDIARYTLRARSESETVSKEVTERYDRAMKLLDAVQAGKRELIGPDGLTLSQADGPGGSVRVSSKLDGRHGRAGRALEGYIQ